MYSPCSFKSLKDILKHSELEAYYSLSSTQRATKRCAGLHMSCLSKCTLPMTVAETLPTREATL